MLKKCCDKSVNFLVVVLMVEFAGFFGEKYRKEMCLNCRRRLLVVWWWWWWHFFCLFLFVWWGARRRARRARILWIVKEMRKFLRRESGRRKISWKNIGEKKKFVLLWNIWWFFSSFFCDYWWGVDCNNCWLSLELLLLNALDVGCAIIDTWREHVVNWVSIWGCKSWSGG